MLSPASVIPGLYVVQPVHLDVPSLEVNIDHPRLCLVEVQGLHHLMMTIAIKMVMMRKTTRTTDREGIFDKKLFREDVVREGDLS